MLKTSAGATYAGEWSAGKRHGTGTMKYADGGKYAGSWKFNKRHGMGTFTYPSGDSYTGMFHAGQKHGEGKYTASAASCVYEGTWQFGTMKASKVEVLTVAPGYSLRTASRDCWTSNGLLGGPPKWAESGHGGCKKKK